MRTPVGYEVRENAIARVDAGSVRMVMLFYIVLAVVLYVVLADRTDRAFDREMQERRPDQPDPRLVEDFDARPDLGPRYGRGLGRHALRSSGARSLPPTEPNDNSGGRLVR